MIPILIYLLIGVAITLILVGLFGSPATTAKRIPLPQDEAQIKKGIQSYLTGIFPFSKKLLEKLKLEAKLKMRLDAAHVKLAPQEFFNIKLVLMIVLAVLTCFVLPKPEPVLFAVPIIFGYIIPDLWLNKRIARRKSAIIFLLPETVDLIGLCVEAGLDFTAALRWLVERVTPPNAMTEELAFLLEEIKWGKNRTQALKDMSKRLNIPELNSFVQTLVQAERMGTPVGEIFKIISEDTRAMRFQRGERLALKAPIKILIPLVLCILPVIAIIVAGPLLLQFLQGNLLQNIMR